LSRESISARYLVEPAPSEAERARAYTAAMTAPDHGAIRPWRFFEMEGAALERLGDVYAEQAARTMENASPEAIDEARKKALRSPLLIAVGAVVRENHPKVPVIEQVIAAGCAAQNLMTAFHAMGYGAIMVTGNRAYDEGVKAALGLAPKDHIVSFIHVGTPQADRPAKPKQRPAFQDHRIVWPAA